MRKQFRFVATAASVAMLATATAAQQSGSSTAPQSGSGTPSTQSARPSGQGRTTNSGASSAAKTTLASADEKFIKDAAMGGQAEVELGRLASTKASNPDVKQFGQRMVDDHGKAN